VRKGNIDRRKTTLARLGTLEDVVSDLLEHLETERVADRLTAVEEKAQAHHRFLTDADVGKRTLADQLADINGALDRVCHQLEDLEDAAARARESFRQLGARMDTVELIWWKRWWRRVKQWLSDWQ
jgi:ABC-type transporter Mla subunit MlaD